MLAEERRRELRVHPPAAGLQPARGQDALADDHRRFAFARREQLLGRESVTQRGIEPSRERAGRDEPGDVDQRPRCRHRRKVLDGRPVDERQLRGRVDVVVRSLYVAASDHRHVERWLQAESVQAV